MFSLEKRVSRGIEACLLLLLAICGCSQETTSEVGSTEGATEVVAVEGPPEAVAEESVYDFGVMEVGEELEHVFEIKNVGEGVLKLTPGKASCKCTHFTVDKEELKSGEVAKATVKWRPVEVQETFRQAAPIDTNDPQMPKIQLNIHGKVKSIFTVKPGLTWDLGEFTEGESKEFPGFVYCNLEEKFQIEDLKTSNPELQATIEPASDVDLKKEGAKSGYKIKLTAGKALPVGEFAESLTFKCRATKDVDMRVDLKGHRAGPLRVVARGMDPKTLTWELGTFDARKGIKQKLSLFFQSASGTDLKFENVESNPPGIIVSLSKDENFKGRGQRYVADVEIPPGDKAQILNEGKSGTVRIQTNAPEIGVINLKMKYNALLN